MAAEARSLPARRPRSNRSLSPISVYNAAEERERKQSVVPVHDDPKDARNAGLFREEVVRQLQNVFVIQSRELGNKVARLLTRLLVKGALYDAVRTKTMRSLLRRTRTYQYLVLQRMLSVGRRELGKGTFGKVYAVQVIGDDPMDAVVKIPRHAGGTEGERHAALEEILVQLLLSIVAAPHAVAAARRLQAEEPGFAQFRPPTLAHVERHGLGIPRVRFVVRYGADGPPVAVVERFDRNLAALFRRSPLLPQRQVLGVLCSIAHKLTILQHVTAFVHRDLHAGNVMVNVDEDNAVVTDVVFIDFGQACFHLDACGMNCQVMDGSINAEAPSYRKRSDNPRNSLAPCHNASHDMRMLLANLYFRQFEPEEGERVRQAYPLVHAYLRHTVVDHAKLASWEETYKLLDNIDDWFYPHVVAQALAKIGRAVQKEEERSAAAAAAAAAAAGRPEDEEERKVQYLSRKEQRRRHLRNVHGFASDDATQVPVGSEAKETHEEEEEEGEEKA